MRDPLTPLGGCAETLGAFAARRLACEPVSRILGRREFWNLPFRIDAAVLDPRPETECLVAFVLETLGRCEAGALSVLDLGTGSGAILCALLASLPLARGIGLDRSEAACRVAVGNAAALGLSARVQIVCGDWADGLRGPFQVIVSNPPYVEREAIAGLAREVRDFDPRGALDGGRDGLDPYRRIATRLGGLLADDGFAAFECGAAQASAVAGLLGEAGLRDVAIRRDLAGQDRVVAGFAARAPNPVKSSPVSGPENPWRCGEKRLD